MPTKNKKKSFLANLMAGPFGSYIKAFLPVVISLYLIELSHGRQLFDWSLDMVQTLLTGAFVSTAPLLINWINPKYEYPASKPNP